MKISYLVLLSLVLLIGCSDNEDITPSNEECTFTEQEEMVIKQLSEDYHHPFETAEPHVREETLDPLIEYLGDARIVGLGEATHGSAEFFKMKDKLFRALVTEKDFKAIIFEFPWG